MKKMNAYWTAVLENYKELTPMVELWEKYNKQAKDASGVMPRQRVSLGALEHLKWAEKNKDLFFETLVKVGRNLRYRSDLFPREPGMDSVLVYNHVVAPFLVLSSLPWPYQILPVEKFGLSLSPRETSLMLDWMYFILGAHFPYCYRTEEFLPLKVQGRVQTHTYLQWLEKNHESLPKTLPGLSLFKRCSRSTFSVDRFQATT